MGSKTHSEVGKILNIGSSTVTRELHKLKFICPELFKKGHKPKIPQMYRPSKKKWKELENAGMIKEWF